METFQISTHSYYHFAMLTFWWNPLHWNPCCYHGGHCSIQGWACEVIPQVFAMMISLDKSSFLLNRLIGCERFFCIHIYSYGRSTRINCVTAPTFTIYFSTELSAKRKWGLWSCSVGMKSGQMYAWNCLGMHAISVALRWSSITIRMCSVTMCV